MSWIKEQLQNSRAPYTTSAYVVYECYFSLTWGNQYSRQIDDPEQPPQTANPGQSTANPGQPTANPGQQPSCWAGIRRWVATCCRRQSAPAGPSISPGQQLVHEQPTAGGQQPPATPAITQTDQGNSTIHINPIIKYYQLQKKVFLDFQDITYKDCFISTDTTSY